MNAGEKSKAVYGAENMALTSASMNNASGYLKREYGRKHKPVNRQSAKQKARLQELVKIRARWWKESQASGKPLICGICDEEIRTREELASDHVIPGTYRDDSEENLQPAHGICNEIKGSRRNFKIVRGDKNWRLIHGLL